MKKFLPISLFITISLLSGCLVTSPTKQQTRIDEVPMYGGMDRSQIPEINNKGQTTIYGSIQANTL